MGTLKAVFIFLGNVTGIWKTRMEQKNAAPVVAAQVAQNKVDEQNKIETDIAKRDENEARNRWSK